MPTQHQPSHLISLPAELRANIYGKLFEGHITHLSNDTNSHGKLSAPAILLTNRQICAEALDTYWESTTLQTMDFEGTNAQKIQGSIPRSRWAAISGFDIDVTWACKFEHVYGAADPEGVHELAKRRTERQLRDVGAEELAGKVRVVCHAGECTVGCA